MESKMKTPLSRPLSVLMVNADEFYHVLDNEVEGQLNLVQTTDPNDALQQFHLKPPALVICGIDEDGARFNPLFRVTSRCGIPVIVVASTREAVAAVEGVRHFLDRRAVRAVVNLAQKLLANPLFVPSSPNSYPPPPKAADVDNYGPFGVKVTAAHVVKTDSKRPSVAGRTPMYGTVGRHSSAPPAPDERDISKQTDLATQLAMQAAALSSLQKQVKAIEEQTRVSVMDNGKFINAVAAESAEFYAELKSMINTVAAKSNRSIDEIRAVLNDALPKLAPGDKQIDVSLERLSLSMVERQSQIDALSSAVAKVEAKGAERELDFQDRIDDLVNQITRLSSAPPQADSAANGVTEALLVEFENRFADIEIALARLSKSSGERGSSGDFTSQFEDLWDTQMILKQLENRVAKLEHLPAGAVGTGPASAVSGSQNANLEAVEDLRQIQSSMKKRMTGMDQRFAAFEVALTELERQTEVIAKIPQAQLASFAQRLGSLESRFQQLSESVGDEKRKTVETLKGVNPVSVSFEIRLQQIEAMLKDFERLVDTKTVVLDENKLIEGVLRNSSPALNGAAHPSVSDALRNAQVVQRSILKASSVPPGPAKPKRDSTKATLIGVDTPMDKRPTGDKTR